jgi:hypothetical protein
VFDEVLAYLSDEDLPLLLEATCKPWTPLPGCQTQGYVSEATIVGSAARPIWRGPFAPMARVVE